MKLFRKLSPIWLCPAVLLAPAGCVLNTGDAAPGEPLQHSTQIVARERAAHAEFIAVELSIAAGELRLEGGAKELFEGDFAYTVATWKPEVRFDGNSFRGRLSVRQGSSSATLGQTRNIWKVRLSDDIPIDLNVHCGAGENHLDLSRLDLRSAEVQMGAGSVEMDLRRDPRRNLDVKIEGGVGEAVIRVPTSVGVVARAQGGLGEIHVEGMHKDGNRWVNDSYLKTPTTIRLDVKGGIGQIRIQSE